MINLEGLKKVQTEFNHDWIYSEDSMTSLKKVTETILQIFKIDNLEDKKLYDFFYDEFLEEVCRKISKYNKNIKPNMEFVAKIKDLIQLVLSFFQKNLRNKGYWNAIKNLLSPESDYYKCFYTLTGDEFKTRLISPLEVSQEWKQALKVNDFIDALISEIVIPIEITGWSSVQIIDKINDFISVKPVNSSRIINLNINDSLLAPIDSMTGGNEWRLKLKPGDRIDCRDSMGKYYLSTILDTKWNERKEFEVQVAFRFYCENGIREEENTGKKYIGWSKNYDEWINSYSFRIGKSGTLSKEGLIHCLKVYDEDKEIDDVDDILVNKMSKSILVYRVGNFYSKLLKELVDSICEGKLLEVILEILNDNKAPIEFEMIHNICAIINNLAEIFHRKKALEFIPKFRESIINYISKISEIQLRNIQKERFENLMKYLETILRRIYTNCEKMKVIELLQIDFSKICIKSNFLDRRIQAMKIISDLCKSCNAGVLKYLDKNRLSSFLQETEFLEEIFGPRRHLQLIQRSIEILKMLLVEKKILQKDISMIWECTKDDELKVEIFKLFNDITKSLNPTEILLILENLGKISPNDATEELINLIQSFCKAIPIEQSELVVSKCCEILRNLIFSNECPIQISEIAIAKYSEITTTMSIEARQMNVLNGCIESLKNEKEIIPYMKIIKNILSNLKSIPKKENYEKIKEFVINQKKIHLIILENLNKFLDSGSNNIQFTIYSRARNLSERFDFIAFLFSIDSNIKLDYSNMAFLWNKIIPREGTLEKLNEEILVFFKFLKEICDDQEKFKSIFDIKEMTLFFVNFLNSPERNYPNISEEEQLCIFSFFSAINEYIGFISKTQDQKSPSIENTNQNPPIKIESKSMFLNIQVNVPPSNVIGYSLLWRIFLEAKSPKVAEITSSFLNKLHNSLSREIQKAYAQINQYFIQNFLVNLKYNLKSKDSPEKNQKIIRLISLMKSMIDESEQNGTGGIRSHFALSRGSLITINVINNVKKLKGIPGQIEFKMYNNATLWDLKVAIAEQLKTSPEIMKLNLAGNELNSSDHGKTLANLRFTSKNNLFCNKQIYDDIPKASLLLKDKELNPKAALAFEYIFEMFSTNGKMSPKQSAEFVDSCTNEKCSEEDSRVTGLFQTYDSDKDGFLIKQEFVKFYHDATIDREIIVWSNLSTLGFRNDLVNMNIIHSESINPSSLPRFILSRDPKSFNLLFSILDMHGDVEEQVANLIFSLSTNQEMYYSLLNLDNAGDINWESLLHTNNIYKMFYSLQILSSFLEERKFDANKELEKKKLNWRISFVKKGGIKFFIDFLIFSTKHSSKKSKYENLVIQEIIEIIIYFLNILLYIQTPLKYKSFSETFEKKDSYHESINPQPDKGKEKEGQELTDEKRPGASDKFESSTQPEKIQAPPQLDKTKSEKPFDVINISFEDFPDLYKLVILFFDFNLQIINKEKIEIEEIQILDKCLTLCSICILLKNGFFERFIKEDFQGKKFDLLYRIGLSYLKIDDIRHSYFLMAMIIINSLKDEMGENNPTFFFLNIVLESLFNNQDNTMDQGESLNLLSQIISIILQNSNKENNLKSLLDIEKIFQCISKLVLDHVSTEIHNKNSPDQYMIGLFNILCTIIQHNPEYKKLLQDNKELLLHIFFNCLFIKILPAESGKHEAVKENKYSLFTYDSRSSAFKLLLEIFNYEFLFKECIHSLFSSPIPTKKISYYADSDSRSNLGYAGIENLGCICYMNSILQQFYLVKSFRYSILNVNDNKPPLYTKSSQVDDNLFHQLQYLFGSLELTERQAYRPSDFCYAFKDFDGNSVNTSIQQDAQEFITMLFQKIELLLKDTPQKYLAQSIFGGKLCSQRICKEGCKAVRKSYEDFYDISLGVKDSRSIHESFEKFLKPGVISDYFCETCQKKVNIFSQNSIGELPNVLIIHLQRIIFNFDIFMNEKINSYLEFPNSINLEPYTEEGIEARNKKKNDFTHGHDKSYYEYKLVGVVVHVGTADAGHYYSYINTNREENELNDNYLFTEKDNWLEFNDSNIKPFDFSKIKSECFGNLSSATDTTNASAMSLFDTMKNAYMLIYERRCKLPLKVVIEKPENEFMTLEEPLTVQQIINLKYHEYSKKFYDKKANEYFSLVPFHKVEKIIQKSIQDKVLEDNNNFIYERQIYSLDFFGFMKDLSQKISEISSNINDEMARLISNDYIKYIYEILAKAYYNSSIKEVSENLFKAISNSVFMANQIIDSSLKDNLQLFINIMLKSIEKSVRSAVGQIYKSAILKLVEEEKEKILIYETIKDDKGFSGRKYQTKVGAFLNECINNINYNCATNWTHFENFFEFLNGIRSKLIAEYYYSHDLISILIDFYLGAKSPILRPNIKKTEMGNAYSQPDFGPLLELIFYLSLYSIPQRYKNESQKSLQFSNYYLGGSSPLELSQDDEICLLHKFFWRKCLDEGNSQLSFSSFIGYWCFENERISKIVALAILKGLNNSSYLSINKFLLIMKTFLLVEDSLIQSRIEWLLGVPTLIQHRMDLQIPSETFGLCAIKSIDEDVFSYSTSLNIGDYINDPVLSLLWKYRERYEQYIITSLKNMLSIMSLSSKILIYIFSCPSPSYRYESYFDWINPFLIKQQEKIPNNQFMTTKEKEDAFKDCQESFQLISKCEETLKILKCDISFKGWLIGPCIKETVVIKETKEDISLQIKEYSTLCFCNPTTKIKDLTLFNSCQELINKFKKNEITLEDILKIEDKSLKCLLLNSSVEIEIVNSSMQYKKVKVCAKEVNSTNCPFIPKTQMKFKVSQFNAKTVFTSPKILVSKDCSTYEINWSIFNIKSTFSMPIKHEQPQTVTFVDYQSLIH